LNAFLWRRQEEAHDSLWASDRDSRSATAEMERQLVQERLLWLARRDVQEWRPVPRLRDAWQKAAYWMAPQPVLAVLRAALLKALSALRQAQTDESASLKVWRPPVPQASRLEAPLPAWKLAPWAPQEP
jgi:hypothetical protein